MPETVHWRDLAAPSTPLSAAAVTPLPDPILAAREALEPVIARALASGAAGDFARCASIASEWEARLQDAGRQHDAALVGDIARVALRAGADGALGRRPRTLLVAYVHALRSA